MAEATSIASAYAIDVSSMSEDGCAIHTLRGEHLVVTRDGHPVAELRPVQRPRLDAARLLARWNHLPHINAAAFRTDIDEILDADL